MSRGLAAAAGHAGSNTAADHIAVVRQLPLRARGGRVGRKVLIRTDAAGGTHEFVEYLTPAYDAHGTPRDGAWVAEATGVLDLTGWPAGMRVIVRTQRPHPGAQLRFTDLDGLRLTAFVTNTRRGQLADLELRHRRRARPEDRVRTAKDTGLTNLPLHNFAQNQIWLVVVALAVELTAWMQMLALADHPHGSVCACSPSPAASPAEPEAPDQVTISTNFQLTHDGHLNNDLQILRKIA